MNRPVVLIVSVAAGAFLVAGAGASAHTIQLITKSAGTHSTLSNDEASGARTESPEPSEKPESTPKAEPSERPEPAENEDEADDNDTETGDNEGDHQHGDQHKDGGEHESSGGGDD